MPFNSNTNRTNLPPDVSGNLDDIDNAALTQPCVKYIKGEYWIINPIRDKETKEIVDYQPVRPCEEGDLNNNLLIPADWIPRSNISLRQAQQDLHAHLKDYFDRKKKNNDFLATLAKKQKDFVNSKAEPITAETTMEEYVSNPNVPVEDKIANFFLLTIPVEDPDNPRQKVSLREMLARKQASENGANPKNALIDEWLNSKETLNASKDQKKASLPLYEDNFLHADPNFKNTYQMPPAVTTDPSEKAKPGFVYMGQAGKSPLYSASSHEVIAPAMNTDYDSPRFRNSEISEGAAALSGPKRGGLLLTGDAGVGKTAIGTAIGLEANRNFKNTGKIFQLFDINMQQQINAGSGLFGEHQKKTGALKADIEYNNTGKRLFKQLFIKKYSIDMEWLESLVAQRTPLGTISAAEVANQTLDQLADILYKAGKLPEVVTGLLCDEAHTLVEVGKNGDSTSAFIDEFKIWIESGLCRPILITTLAEKDKFLKDQALKRRLTEITVQELSKHDTFEILKDLAAERMAENRDTTPIKISDETIQDILDISEDSLPNIRRPAAPIKLLDNVITDVINKNYFQTLELVQIRDEINKLNRTKKHYRAGDLEFKLATDQIKIKEARYEAIKKEIEEHNKQLIKNGGVQITKNDILASVYKQINMDPAFFTKNPKERRIALEKALYSNIIGHDAALEKIVDMFIAKMSPLNEHRKAPFVCLFTGVAGTGKTEIGRVVAKATGSKILVLPMNDYQSSVSESNLFGSARGLIGSDQQTAFVAFLKANPQGIVVLDEFEKAYPGISNKFLQIFETGFFIDQQTNEKIDTRGVTFILTSNALEETLASNPNQPTNKLISDLKSYKGTNSYGNFINADQQSQIFNAALLSRIGKNIFGFGNLTQGQMFQLVELKLKKEAEKCLNSGVKLTLDFGQPTQEYLDAKAKYEKSIANKSESERIVAMRKWEENNSNIKYPDDSIVYYLLSVIRSQNGDGRFVEKVIQEKIDNKLNRILNDSDVESYKHKTVKISSGLNPETGKWDVIISEPEETKQEIKTVSKKTKQKAKKI